MHHLIQLKIRLWLVLLYITTSQVISPNFFYIYGTVCLLTECNSNPSEILTKYLICPQVDMKSSGKTAVQVAAHQGHLDIVRLLLAAGANLQMKDEDGDTALHYSAFGYNVFSDFSI